MIYLYSTDKVCKNSRAMNENRLLRLVEFTALNFSQRELVKADFKDGKLSISSYLDCDRY